MTYWKATRLNGTDFHTGTVDYAAALESGVPVTAPVIGLANDHSFPGPKWLHLATVPTECVGMSWPCRLFEVEPVGDVFMDNAHPHKIGARSVRVLREIEAHRVFGPQGEQVAALIECCRTLSAAELDRLYTAWYAAGYAARYAARDADRDAAGDDARVAARDAAGDAARAAAGYAARYAARDAARAAARAAAGYAARDAAGDAAGDTACALTVRDLIGQRDGWDQAAYDALTGPWRRTIGPIHPDDEAVTDGGGDE